MHNAIIIKNLVYDSLVLIISKMVFKYYQPKLLPLAEPEHVGQKNVLNAPWNHSV